MNKEDYCPIKEKFYNYKDKNSLSHNFSSKELTTYNNIYSCPYSVNTSGKYPFLMFLLSTLNPSKELLFQTLPNSHDMNSSELTNFAKVCLFDLIQYTNSFDEFNDSLIFDGFFEYDNNLYLFFNVTNVNVQIYEDFINPICFALVDEIVNPGTVCNVTVHTDVVNLLTHNDDFCFLCDEIGDSYEIPVVCYVDKPKRLVNFSYVFGETARDNNSIVGPYYYFTNFENAYERSKSQPTLSGLIRFAIFSGKVKYIENNYGDDVDDSEMKQARLKDPLLNQEMENLTLRISDYNGKWTEQYDSAYLGHIELDNGTFYQDTSVLVVKDFDQQVSLSYHYL